MNQVRALNTSRRGNVANHSTIVQHVHDYGDPFPNEETFLGGPGTMADCCTANNGQGWPKFALRVVFRTPADDGIAIGAFAPVRANLTGGGTLLLNTQYPFEDRVEVLLRATKTTPLRVRVPAWATTALA